MDQWLETRGIGRIFPVLVLIALIVPAREARAHRDDYLNETVVYLTLERSEVEAEYWFDAAWTPGAPVNSYRHNTALEWGITDHWMADGRATVTSQEGAGTEFDSGRLESRYRFSEEGELPVDVAVSLEVNSERQDDGSTAVGIEPRLILSRDVAEKFNLTVNLSEEIPTGTEPSAFLEALGARFNWTPLVRLGSEFQYNNQADSGAVIPQVWLAFRRDVTLKLGASLRVDQETRNFARAALEVEF